MPHRLQQKIAASTLMLLLSTAVAHAAQPPVLQQVPDDVPTVLVVKNLKQITTKAANAATRMKITMPEDLLATLMGRYGVSDGLDQNGSAAIIMLLPAKDDSSPPSVAILPATDSKAMLKSFEAQTPDAAGIVKLTLPGEEPGFGAVSGKYVLLSHQKTALEKILARTGTLDKTLSPAAATAFDDYDIVFFTNPQMLGDHAKQAIEDMREKMKSAFAKGTAGAAQNALAVETFDAAFDVAEQSLKDATSALVTFKLNDDGAVIGTIGQFKPDSPTGKFIAAQKAAKPANLTGLPAGKILLAAAGQWDSNTLSTAFNAFADRLLADPNIKDDATFADIKKALEAQKAAIATSSGMRLALYEPTDEKNGWLNMVVLADTSDPQKTLDAVVAAAQTNFGTDSPLLKINKTIQENAKSIKGISFTRLSLTFTAKDDKAPGTDAAMNSIKTLFGEEGLEVYYGMVGKQILTVAGHDPKLLEDAVTAAQAADVTLAKEPQMVAANKSVPADALAIAYLPVSRWVYLGLKAMGMSPAEAPADKPVPTPITISLTITGTTASTEMRIPMSTLIELSTTVQQNLGNLFPH